MSKNTLQGDALMPVIQWPARPFSQLGLDADAPIPTDVAFYEWIVGQDPEKSAGEFYRALIDDLREEHDPHAMKQLLDDWHARLPKEAFFERLDVFSKLMPPTHVFHQVKQGYS